MSTFQDFGLPAPLLQALEHMKFNSPTPIQEQAIPLALEGMDILGSAQTGTGKTGAFSIPLVAKLLTSPEGMALILTPTRELAVQVTATIHQLLGRNSPLKTALIIGGESMHKQFQQLRARPRIIIGTPGRINDHLDRGTLRLHTADFLVLDETDRMLDMGFGIQLDKILKYLPEKRQTLMFSATLPANIVRLSQNYLSDPKRISVGSTTSPIAKIKQELIHTSESEKYEKFITQLKDRTGSILVFVKTKWGAEKLAKKLSLHNHSADSIHGDLNQNKRDRVIAAFRNQNYRILVATDIAARGLDIPHIEHVINYDLPQCPEDYIHRIGRTGRAGAEGSAVCFITPEDGKKWKAIHHLLHGEGKVKEGPHPHLARKNKSESFAKKENSFRSSKPFSKNSSEKPFRSSSEKPFKSTSEKPFRSSSEKSFKSTSEKPFRNSSEKPFRSSSEKPFKSTSEKPFRSSSEKPFKSASEKPFRSSSEKPFKSTSEKPFRSSSEKPFKKTFGKSFKKSKV